MKRTSLRTLALEGAALDGRGWYDRAHAEVRRYSDSTHGMVPTGELCDILSIVSPRVSVKVSVRLAEYWLAAGVPHPSTMRSTRVALAHYAATGEIRGPKTSAFARALRGDTDAVVVDVWVWRAMGRAPGGIGAYRAAERTLRRVARSLGWPPAETQAAIWVGVRARHGYRPVDLTLPGAA